MIKPLRFWLAMAAAAGSFVCSQGAWAQDAQTGEKRAQLCIGCHGIPGYQASFPEVYKVPMIAGQNAKYLISALTQYKKGDRKHPTMRAIAASLTDKDMADLAAFYAAEADAPAAPETLAVQPSAEVAALLAKANCVSCHGANFSKPIDTSYPKLAGQHSSYLIQALRSYQTSNNALVGRNNAIMMGMARPYTPSEVKLIANYIASLPSELKTVPQSRWR